jgi:hypothetical protein
LKKTLSTPNGIIEGELGWFSGLPRLKELNPRWRVNVEIPKPSRVELNCSKLSP